MTAIPPTGAIPPTDSSARAAALSRQAQLTKPAGALGRLEALSAWACGVQGTFPPERFGSPVVAIFAGDHGVARTAGTSAYPPEVTAQMVLNFLAGGAAANVLARRTGARVEVVDVSVDADAGYADSLAPGFAATRIRRSSGSIDREDAMSPEECRLSVELGRAVADRLVDEGADILIPGDMGIGNTTPAAVLIGLLTGGTAAEVTGRGTGVDDPTYARKVSVVSAAMHRGIGHVSDADALLRTVASPDIAAMSGFLEQAARRRTPVVLDGVVSCAAALVTRLRAPGAEAWWAAGHVSTEPAARRALEALRLEPLIDLGLRLGEGTGALLALDVLDAAILTLNEMATFESAGVSDKGAGTDTATHQEG